MEARGGMARNSVEAVMVPRGETARESDGSGRQSPGRQSPGRQSPAGAYTRPLFVSP